MGVRKAVGTSMLIGAGAIGVACSFVVDADKPQCTTDADCTSRGAPFERTVCTDSHCVLHQESPPLDSGAEQDSGDPNAWPPATGPWRCVGKPWGTLVPTETVTRYDQFVVYGTGTPVPDVPVSVCNPADLECEAPSDAGTTFYTDDAGKLATTVPKFFDGYLAANPAAAAVQTVFDPLPLLVYIFPPPGDSQSFAKQAIPVTSRSTLVQMGEHVQPPVTVDPERGHLTFAMVDCDENAAPGVMLEVVNAPTDSRLVYLPGALPSSDATETAGLCRVVYANLPPGIYTIKARLASNGKVIGKRQVIVRKGALTTSYFPPTPDPGE